MNEELNLLPFNLEESLKNPERVIYRNGEKPLEWHYFKCSKHQIVSVNSQKEIQAHYEDGASSCYDELDEYLGIKSKYDLFLLPIEEKTYWINIYKDHQSNDILVCGTIVFESEFEARHCIDHSRIYCRTISFTITTQQSTEPC